MRAAHRHWLTELWRRWRRVTLLDLLVAIAAFVALYLSSVLVHIDALLTPRKLMGIALFALYAIPFRYAIATVEPSDGRPVRLGRYAVGCLVAAMLCSAFFGTVVRTAIPVGPHPKLPLFADLWQGFFPPLSYGLALTFAYATARNKRRAQRLLQKAEVARAELARQTAHERVEALSQRLDVDGMREALSEIDREYERDAQAAGRRIDALIASLREATRDGDMSMQGPRVEPVLRVAASR